jgi:hypothetical protein
MPNTTLTHKMIAREAASILEEEAPFLMNVNRGRQDEFATNINGYNKGDYVDIKVPPTPVVYNGSQFAGGGSAPDNTEGSVRLQLNTQKHVPLQFGAKEKLLEITEFKDRILRPAMRGLSSVVEADLISQAVLATPNSVGTAGSTPTDMKTYGQARAAMQRYLAPESDRFCLFTSDANVNMVDASKALFHAKSEIESGFLRGKIGEAQGADFYEHQSMPVHTLGNQAAWTINGASQTGTTLNIGGLTSTQTISKGTMFTIPSVFAVHPLTGVSTGALQQFVVTADFTAAGTTGSISIFPAIQPSATVQNRTVTASPGAGATVSLIGSVSTAYRWSLMAQKDAYTVATAPLPVLASCEGYTARMPSGVSVRVMTFGDGNNDYERTRIDVLYGFAAVRALHACRIPG